MQWVVALLALWVDIHQEGVWNYNKKEMIESPAIETCPRCRRAQPPGPRKLPYPNAVRKGGQK